MKSHAIIPVFIPHKGCPNSCVFCNQNKITENEEPASAEDVSGIIASWLRTLKHRGIGTIEAAFYGGSFTGIPIEQRSEYLKIARFYKDRGDIAKIRLSTRPDYIDDEILSNLKEYKVDTIELGVQSFDDEVLLKSNRGHSSKAVYESSRMIKDYGFDLGLQLMIGLPGDTAEKDIFSANELVKIKPEVARLYPTNILEGTELHKMYLAGEYALLTLEEAVDITKKMYKIISGAGINIIRVGLKGGFHSAFRQLVESEIARDELERQLDSSSNAYRFICNEKSFSNMIGHMKSNKIYFNEKYPLKNISYEIDNALADAEYVVV